MINLSTEQKFTGSVKTYLRLNKQDFLMCETPLHRCLKPYKLCENILMRLRNANMNKIKIFFYNYCETPMGEVDIRILSTHILGR